MPIGQPFGLGFFNMRLRDVESLPATPVEPHSMQNHFHQFVIAFEVNEFRVALCIGLMIKYHMQESIMEENENEEDLDFDFDDASMLMWRYCYCCDFLSTSMVWYIT